MPPLDLDPSDHWAAACYNKLCAVDLRPVTQKAKRAQNDLVIVFDQAPTLRALQPTPADHSGHASTLLTNKDGRRLLREALELDSISFPKPADNSTGRQADARCVICKNTGMPLMMVFLSMSVLPASNGGIWSAFPRKNTSGKVRFITRPKSRTMRAKRKKNVRELTERRCPLAHGDGPALQETANAQDTARGAPLMTPGMPHDPRMWVVESFCVQLLV